MFLLFSIPVILSQGPWSGFRIFDMDLFVFLDRLSGTFLLPTGALAVSLYVVFVWTFDRFRDDTNVGSGSVKINVLWKPLVVFVIPAAVIVVLLMGLQVL